MSPHAPFAAASTTTGAGASPTGKWRSGDGPSGHHASARRRGWHGRGCCPRPAPSGLRLGLPRPLPRPALLLLPGARRGAVADRRRRHRAAGDADPHARPDSPPRPERRGGRLVSGRARTTVFTISAVALAAFLAWGFSGLPSVGDFHGRYSELITRIAVPERHASDIVATTVFDIRGADTLIEELILFAAALGVLVLLRLDRGESEVVADSLMGEPVGESRSARAVCAALVGPVLVLGLYVIAHGHLTPGGGFQGGLILMSAVLLAYLGGVRGRTGGTESVAGLELADGLGAAGFALIGLGGLFIAGTYLQNFVDLGTFARPWSGGTIPLANISVGLEVFGATLAILSELLDRRLLSGGEEAR